MARLLFNRRHFPILPHRFLVPIRATLVELSQLCDALAVQLDDSRWCGAAAALQRAAAQLNGEV